jgi:hypothetical protein
VEAAVTLQQRVVGMLTDPKREWPLIAAEPSQLVDLYRGYILILAAIPAVCVLLRMAVFSTTVAVAAAVAQYLSAVILPIVAALAVEKLAPKFNSRGDTAQALKLVAYAWTPVWVAGVLYLFVGLAPLVALAVLYAIYLFYLGLPAVLGTPHEQAVPFTLISTLVILVASVVLQSVIRALSLPQYVF